VERLRNFFRENSVDESVAMGESGGLPPSQISGGSSGSPPDSRIEAFYTALADDFNTPRAMAEVFELVSEANRGEVPGAAEAVYGMLEVLGLGNLAEDEDGADAEAQGLMLEREQARGEKDFARSDEIRDRLAALGWEVRDSAEGPRLVSRS
ncbi:MAG TPA: DALR domain-containing protein, partial [Solirubrobacterales bacterium]|nr:DALR domain-containing protein [Solirubrobacterales bacterium]